MNKNECPKCHGTEFGKGTDFVAVRPLDKKLSLGSNKIFTFCLNCGEVVSTRIENPDKFRK